MYDILIKNGKIVDGTGTPWKKEDVAIKDGFIKKVRPSIKSVAKLEIDAEDKVVSPGFIDIHSHSDFSVLINPGADSKVKQGVTTDVSGNCGYSAAPLLSQVDLDWAKTQVEGTNLPLNWKYFNEYLDLIEKNGIALNYASYVGHNRIRMSVMGYKDSKPSKEELEGMKNLVKKSIEAGALGLSTGLDKGLLPGCFSDTEEIIELCKVAREANPGAIYTSHIRNRQGKILDAVAEFIQTVKASGIRGQIAHINPRFPDGDKMDSVLEMVEKAREEGFDILFDVGMALGKERGDILEGYHTGWGRLYMQVMPTWALEGGTEQSLKYLQDPKKRKEMKKHEPLYGAIKLGYWDTVILQGCMSRKELEGKCFKEIAELMHKDPWDAAYGILAAEGENFKDVRILCTKHTSESVMKKTLLSPLAMLESDRAANTDDPSLKNFILLGKSPDAFDTFPRFLERYVRDEKILGLEDAIKKITFMPAKHLGLKKRGMISENFVADIVVFDLNKINTRATLNNFAVYPKGINYVIVNGKIVVQEGKQSRVLAGKVLRLN